jgi:hypothetical protein
LHQYSLYHAQSCDTSISLGQEDAGSLRELRYKELRTSTTARSSIQEAVFIMSEEEFHLRRRTWSLKSSSVIAAAGLALILATAQAQQAGTPAASQDGSAATNAANNPTTPKLTFEAQDYWMPSVSGLGGRGGSNGLQRNIVPIRTFGIWNLFHVILPVDTNPNSPGGNQTGLGGLQFYNLSTVKLHGTTYGAGPLVVLPTESGSHFGTEKWQAGVGGVAIDATKWGLLGGLFTYQHAFGKGTGAITQETTFQPFIHYNFHHGLYLRSTGLLVFNSGSGVKDIPVGLGSGKVWNFADGKTINFYIEPQYSVWRSGVGAPGCSSSPGSTSSFPSTFNSGASRRGADDQSLKG